MKRILVLPLCLVLSGCPSGDHFNIGQWRVVSVDHRRICFTVDKSDVLTRYHLGLNESGKETTILDSGYDPVSLAYPATCMNTELKTGSEYYVVYELNGIKYRYEFIIDNTWKVFGLKGDK